MAAVETVHSLMQSGVMRLMLCTHGTPETNTVTGKVYECVGSFFCPKCGFDSPILEFAEPVQEFDSIRCFGCRKVIKKVARYSHRDRFVPINDAGCLESEVMSVGVLETICG